MRLDRLHLHFMGAGGVGMAALAELHLARGGVVSGCDTHPGQRLEELRRRGARISAGHSLSHVAGADALVYSAAIPSDHEELAAARSAGIPVVRRATLLGEVMRGHTGLAVSGTHGKTTTTALLGWILSRCGLDPTVVAGGFVPAFHGHARRGCGPVMVCEADEYDRSFLELRPAWLIVTNVEPEHLEVYGTVEALEAAFVELALRLPFHGALVVCTDDPGASRVARVAGGRVLSYGTGTDAWLRAESIRPEGGGSAFVVRSGGRRLGELRLPMPGVHNVRNALAATAVALDLGVEFQEIAIAAAAFSGVARRFQVLGNTSGITVIDDYAHHPTELEAVIAAARERFAERRLVVVFQPHLYTRTQQFSRELGRSLAAADVVIVLPIFPAREAPIPGVDAILVARAVESAGGLAEAVDSPDRAMDRLREILSAGDVLLTAGAGDVDRLARRWLEESP